MHSYMYVKVTAFTNNQLLMSNLETAKKLYKKVTNTSTSWILKNSEKLFLRIMLHIK